MSDGDCSRRAADPPTAVVRCDSSRMNSPADRCRPRGRADGSRVTFAELTDRARISSTLGPIAPGRDRRMRPDGTELSLPWAVLQKSTVGDTNDTAKSVVG